MSNTAVSVIVPVYNAERYLIKCLDSIVNQTLKNIEIIIINDGSTDSSSEICKQYANKDTRIRYFYKENEGLAAARQDGIEKANGIYIGFIDSDDWIEADMFERMYNEASLHSADIVFCNCFVDEFEKNSIYLEPGIYDRNGIENDILPRTLAGLSSKGSNSVIRWSNCLRIYRRSLILENNISFGRTFRRSQDLQLTFETTLVANKYVSICDEYLYHNRSADNSDSLSRGYTENYWKLIRPLIDKLYEDVDGYHKQDLKKQMDLCTFFFGVNAIKNEYEKSTYPFFTKTKKINEVINDSVLQKSLNSIESSKLNSYYSMIFKALKSQKTIGVFYHYCRFNFICKIYKPLARKLINGKITGVLFKHKKN